MITKSEAIGTVIDWEQVTKAAEIPRTYLVREECTGREFFKMYKPSEAQRIFTEKGWNGRVVSRVRRR